MLREYVVNSVHHPSLDAKIKHTKYISFAGIGS